ncbi:MAG: hypothetical protein ACTS45_01045 [Candidatus Hodgkinia cicadicola]
MVLSKIVSKVWFSLRMVSVSIRIKTFPFIPPTEVNHSIQSSER